MRDWAHSRRLGTPADEAGYVVLRQPPASELANLFRIDAWDHALGLVRRQVGGRVTGGRWGAIQRRSRFWVACAWSCCLVRAWSRPCLRELASKMRPSFVIMAWFYARPPCKQGRSHGCTVFGSLGAGISETGTTPRQACRVALRFDASVCHSASLETSQTRRQAARLPRPDTLDAATPHPDCRHHDLVCRGNGRRPLRAVPSLLRPDSCPQATATWQDLQRLLRGDAPSAHARLVGILRCRAVARLPPLGRPHDHGRLVAVGV